MDIGGIDVGSAPSAADLVFESLRRAIISGSLEDGHALRQEDLARRFNTSRIPVREALTRLEQHGLARIRRFHGYTVAGLAREEIEEICRFRALVEGEVVVAAVPRISAATLALARRQCEAFARERDPVLYGERNREFHYTLYKECALPYHLAAIQAALDRTERYLVDQLVLTSGMRRARSEHLAILEAFEARDARLAARLTRAHILGACQRFGEYMDAHPEAGHSPLGAGVPTREATGESAAVPSRTGPSGRRRSARRA